MTRFLSIWLAGAFSVCAAEYHVATNGTSLGDGSRVSPWDMTTALQTQDVVPGSTIWVHGDPNGGLSGTYGFGSNVFTCTLLGASNAPIIVRQAPGERAIIDGGIYCSGGNWVTFWGFEITCSQRRTNSAAFRPAGLVFSAQGHKAVNLTIRNSGHPGINGGGSEVYGCVLDRIGIYDTNFSTGTPANPLARGSALYLQNPGSWDYDVGDNISFGNLNAGMKAYGQDVAAERFRFNGNVVFNNGGEGIEIEVTDRAVTNALVVNNVTYHCLKTPMGYFNPDEAGVLGQHYNLIYAFNYEIGNPGYGASTLWIKRWRNVLMVSNTIATVSSVNDWSAGSGDSTNSSGKFIDLYPGSNLVNSSTYTINYNAYWGGVDKGADFFSPGMFFHTYQPFRYNSNALAVLDGTNGPLSFVAWTNAHGFDRSSTYTTNLPTSAAFAVIRTNKYERGRANITVINWQSNATVNVNLSGVGLTNGQLFIVRDSQNYFGSPVYSNSFNGGAPTISLSLTNTAMSPVTVPFDEPVEHTASLFNAFVLTPVETVITNELTSDFSAKTGRGRGRVNFGGLN